MSWELYQEFTFNADVGDVVYFLTNATQEWRYYVLHTIADGTWHTLSADSPFGFRQRAEGPPPTPADAAELRRRVLYLQWDSAVPGVGALYQMYLNAYVSGHPSVAWLQSAVGLLDLKQAKPGECIARLFYSTLPKWYQTKEPVEPIVLVDSQRFLARWWILLIELWGQNRRATTAQIRSAMRLAQSSKRVFVVHGYDDGNRRRLEDLLRNRWGLVPVVLLYEPGKGRTIIEKFEQEAGSAEYAFVLVTSDDVVKMERTRYFQARPNVLFELGWFYGRLGRSRVCLVYKKGTKIPTDLAGISRIEFVDSVEEIITAIEKELCAVGLLTQGVGSAGSVVEGTGPGAAQGGTSRQNVTEPEPSGT